MPNGFLCGASAINGTTYGTIYYGGKVWLYRNLGVTQLPSSLNHWGNKLSVCGNYYKWGRGNDVYEKYNSTISDV